MAFLVTVWSGFGPRQDGNCQYDCADECGDDADDIGDRGVGCVDDGDDISGCRD